MSVESSDSRKAWCISIFLHINLFFLVAASGFFLLARPVEEREAIEVVLYEGEGSQGGSASLSAPATAADVLEVAIPTEIHLPEIQEEYTKHPEHQQEFKQEHQKAEQPVSVPSQAKGTADGAGSGIGGAERNALQGNGQGSGTGSGKDTGGEGVPASSEPPAAPRERTAAACIGKGAVTYPESMRSIGAEGTVRIRFYVSADGAIERLEILQSSGYAELDSAAMQAAYGYRFSSGTNPGVFTDSFTFQLTDEDDW